jgi:hypothetical protein
MRGIVEDIERIAARLGLTRVAETAGCRMRSNLPWGSEKHIQGDFSHSGAPVFELSDGLSPFTNLNQNLGCGAGSTDALK